MQQHTANLGRVISSLAAMLALFVLAPWLLISAARLRFESANPLADIAPPWRWSPGEIGDVVSEPLRDDAVVNLLIRSSLTIIWLALATVAITIVVEVIHMVRHRGMASPRVRGLGWAQRIARWIAVGIIALLPLNSFGSAATALEQSVGPAATAQRFAEPVTSAPVDSRADHTSRQQLEAPPSYGDEHRSPGRLVDAAEQALGVASHTVRRGESIYGIAGDYAAGESQRTNEIADAILDLNLGEPMNDGQRFLNPALIQPGWNLTLPAGVGQVEPSGARDGSLDDVPDADGFDISLASDDPTPVRGIPYVVVSGDTLSEIAGDHLGDQDAWPQIWEQNAGDDMGGDRTFDDPNLILPGWEIDVPAPDPAISDPAPAPDPRLGDPAVVDTDAPEPDAEATESPVPIEVPDDDTADDVRNEAGDADPVLAPVPIVESVPAPTAPPSTAPSSTAPSSTIPSTTAPATTAAATVTPPTTDPFAAGAGDQAGPVERGESAPQAPSPIRLEHAALLAAGVLTLIGVRRRRALRAALPHARVPTPPPEIAATERRLRTIDPGERAARVDIAVRAIAHRIAGSGTQVGTIRIAPDGELIVRLTAAARLDAPWIPAERDDSARDAAERDPAECGAAERDPAERDPADEVGAERTWTLPASVPIEMVSEDARRAGQPCLALVTVGIDADGRDVLLDLEAAGVTAIEASARQGDEVVRAIASGLATSLSCEVIHLLVAGIGTDVLFDHPNTRRLERAADAVDAAAQTVGSTLANERSAFDLRTRRTGGEMWEPAIVLLAHADDAANALATVPAVGHGIAAVAAVDPGGLDGPDDATDAIGANIAGARIRAHADRWELVAFDESIELTPIGLSDDDVAEIATILDDAATPIEASPIVHVDLDELVADPLEVLPHDIVVTLMGGVSIVDRNGDAGTFERSKTVELIAWLANHRERATRTAARTALWELDVRDATFANVVSEARRGLGRLVTPPEGEEWIARTLNESLPLHHRVVTDADLIRQRVEHAQVAPPAHAIDVLRPAVEMIHGLPFAGSSYLWPDADGLTSNLVLLATTAAAELAAHALSVGHTELVFWATGQGLKVLPGHEELIGLRMRAHARAGDLSGVRQEWESYERVITADSWSDGEPAPKLLDLRRQLLTPAT